MPVGCPACSCPLPANKVLACAKELPQASIALPAIAREDSFDERPIVSWVGFVSGCFANGATLDWSGPPDELLLDLCDSTYSAVSISGILSL